MVVKTLIFVLFLSPHHLYVLGHIALQILATITLVCVLNWRHEHIVTESVDQ